MCLKSESKDPSEQIVNHLILDIKALMLLGQSKESLRQLLDLNLAQSHDEHIVEFLELMKPGKKKGISAQSYLIVAIGELILSSFLLIGGLATILPSLVGLTSPEQLVSFIGDITQRISVPTLSNPIVPILELVLALALLFGAFNTVRLASINLQEMDVIATSVPLSKTTDKGPGQSEDA